MKSKIIEISSGILLMGVGALITKFASEWAWIGFLLIGLGILGIIMTSLWGKFWNIIPIVRFEKRNRSTRTEDLIVRQIIFLNASRLVNGNAEILDVGVIFPSFIPNRLELMKVRGYINVDSHTTEEQEFRPITLFEHSPNEIQLPIALTPDVSTISREIIKTNNKAEVSLQLTGWDAKNKRYDLSTRGWTSKFLS
jgi:hypothetical protein